MRGDDRGRVPYKLAGRPASNRSSPDAERDAAPRRIPPPPQARRPDRLGGDPARGGAVRGAPVGGPLQRRLRRPRLAVGRRRLGARRLPGRPAGRARRRARPAGGRVGGAAARRGGPRRRRRGPIEGVSLAAGRARAGAAAGRGRRHGARTAGGRGRRGRRHRGRRRPARGARRRRRSARGRRDAPRRPGRALGGDAGPLQGGPRQGRVGRVPGRAADPARRLRLVRRGDAAAGARRRLGAAHRRADLRRSRRRWRCRSS